jgi:hypothetical protein
VAAAPLPKIMRPGGVYSDCRGGLTPRMALGFGRWTAANPMPHGWSALGCAHFHSDDPRRQVWTGKWPGEEDCERLDFFVNGDPDFPDLNRLFTDCVWDADTQRWERKR